MAWPEQLSFLLASPQALPAHGKVCVERVSLCFSQWTSGVRRACARGLQVTSILTRHTYETFLKSGLRVHDN